MTDPAAAPQPDQPVPDQPDQPDQPDKADQPVRQEPRRARRPIVTLVLAAAAVVAVLAAGAWWAVTATRPQPTSDAQPAVCLSPSKTRPSRAIPQPLRAVTIVAPDRLGNRPKNVEAKWVKAAEDRAARYNRATGTRVFVSAYYGSESAGNLVLINAVPVPLPQDSLEILLNLLAREPDTCLIKPFESVDAGSLGGAARCGAIKAKGVQTAVCGWSDGGSMGIVTWHGTGLEKAAGEFGTIRAAIEHEI